MAISSGTANVQILIDTSSRLVARFLYYTSNGANETDSLKINVSTLAAQAYSLVVANSNVYVQPGAVVVGTTSNAHAIVSEWNKAVNTAVITALTGNTAFADNEVLTFTFGNTTLGTCNSKSSSAFVTPARNLDITSVWYSISAGMTVELGFGGAYANSTAYVAPSMLLSGSGYFGKNALPAQLDNPVLNPTGNFYISTYNDGTLGTALSYTVITEFRKTAGFVAVPGY